MTMTITTTGLRAVGLALAAGLLVACGGLSQEDLDRAREAGASEAASRAAEQQRTEELQQQVEELKRQKQENAAQARRAERRAIKAERRAARSQNSSGGGSSTSGSATACGDGVYAGANTSCAFAMNVVGEYGSNPGASTIEAYSPVTGQYYTMSCGTAANGGHVCTGGNNAAVYFP